MSDGVLDYQGRLPKRAGSLTKRNKILEASLLIIQKEGLRGVRHRAVAELAQVPLSATTYYFSDINELIVDSFVYFTEKNSEKQILLFNKINKDISARKNDLQSLTKAIEYFHDLLLNYLIQQISDTDSRIIERAFIQYASRSTELSQKVLSLHNYFETQLCSVLKHLGLQSTEIKAHLLLAFINLTEERALLSGQIDKKKLSQKVRQLLENLLI